MWLTGNWSPALREQVTDAEALDLPLPALVELEELIETLDHEYQSSVWQSWLLVRMVYNAMRLILINLRKGDTNLQRGIDA